MDFVVAREVLSETLYVRTDDANSARARIDLERLVSKGVIQILDLEDGEVVTFVSAAARVDDGEAATLALAVHRGLPLATDDRAALRLIEIEYPMVHVLSTAGIVRHYCERADLAPSQVEVVLGAIQRYASYVPPLRDPHTTWWRSAVSKDKNEAPTSQ